jgi:hypothetical protein
MSEELDEILIDKTRDKSESSKDIQRLEEEWTGENSDFFIKIQNEIIQKAKAHDVASHKNKKRYIYTAIPSMIIPILLTNLSIFCSMDTNQFIHPIGLSLVGIINVFQTILNFSKKTEQHNQYCGLYMDLANDIEKILIRKKRFRDPFDLTLERITLRKQQLDGSAPYL